MNSAGLARKLENYVACSPSDVKKNGHTLEFEVPGHPEMLYHIRARVAQFAHSMPFTDDEVDDIKLAVGEASANSVRHGAAASSCHVLIKLENHKNWIRIQVIDTGCGFDPDGVRPRSSEDLSETGRGIMFMKATMDEVKFHPGACGTHVEMIKRVRKAQ